MNPGGSMTGGAFQNSSNLLSTETRDRRICRLTVAMLKKRYGCTAERQIDTCRDQIGTTAGCCNMVDDIRSGTAERVSLNENTAKMKMREQMKTRMKECKTKLSAGYVSRIARKA